MIICFVDFICCSMFGCGLPALYYLSLCLWWYHQGVTESFIQKWIIIRMNWFWFLLGYPINLFAFLCNYVIWICFRFKIPKVILRHPEETVARSSNLVFTIWAVFGGFILHFLLSNYLTVLLRPRYEEPVDNPKDLIDRDITPFLTPGREIYRQFFRQSPDPNIRIIAEKVKIAKDWEEYDKLVNDVIATGRFAEISAMPARPYRPWLVPEQQLKNWYRSLEIVGGILPYATHITNKKWPLQKVV